ncbi:DUF3429 domain-containing protein [uncultured Salinisphaera sp.]|uniref:DUF3429 domain-containing protein n=1 Tax=uncultured Salinisphaera sp. TaxID=359372 RepID=UPI0032B2A14D|tara:strand:+ start:3257 stop:3769 length:513 start_codon:yes stop_codon:yes gene_type:complete
MSQSPTAHNAAAPSANRPSPSGPPSLLLAVGLGLLALVPFIAGVYEAYWGDWLEPARVLHIALVYLATIVSFIGGVQWGLMLARGRAPAPDMVLGVVPALIAWPALLLGPMFGQGYTFGLLLAALVLAWGADERGARQGWQQSGFLQLRRVLTLVVAGCVVAIGWHVVRG